MDAKILTVLSPVHSEKQYSSMLFTVSGIWMDCSSAHP